MVTGQFFNKLRRISGSHTAIW